MILKILCQKQVKTPS